MSKFVTVNFIEWFLKEFRKPSKTYQKIFRKSWVFVLFVISILVLIRLLQFSVLWVLLIIFIIELFNWLAGKHD